MYRLAHASGEPRQPAMKSIRARIEKGGERLWRMGDFSDLPPAAAAQALSRLAKAGFIRRLSKGTYYRAGDSAFGKTRPNPAAIGKLAAKSKALFPSGLSAANRLGLTTQTATRNEIATSAASIPRKLLGTDTIVHTRRPEAWKRLGQNEAALLDFIRNRGRTSELSPEEAMQRIRALIVKLKAFRKLAEAAPTEPPRVRAILGALGEEIGADKNQLSGLRRSLNPLSKFDFGIFAALPNAKDWQAKERRT